MTVIRPFCHSHVIKIGAKGDEFWTSTFQHDSWDAKRNYWGKIGSSQETKATVYDTELSVEEPYRNGIIVRISPSDSSCCFQRCFCNEELERDAALWLPWGKRRRSSRPKWRSQSACSAMAHQQALHGSSITGYLWIQWHHWRAARVSTWNHHVNWNVPLQFPTYLLHVLLPQSSVTLSCTAKPSLHWRTPSLSPPWASSPQW